MAANASASSDKGEIERTCGHKTLDYLLKIAEGRLDYLPRIPRPILIRLIRMLDLQDITALSQVNRFFREICTSNELWEKIYRQNSEIPITAELQNLAEEHGWKKLFFTNKLQLQMHLSRKAVKKTEHKK